MNPEVVERLLQTALERNDMSGFLAQFGDDAAEEFSAALDRSPECVDSFAGWIRGKVWAHALTGTTGPFVANWPLDCRDTFARLVDVALQELEVRVSEERTAIADFQSDPE